MVKSEKAFLKRFNAWPPVWFGSVSEFSRFSARLLRSSLYASTCSSIGISHMYTCCDCIARYTSFTKIMSKFRAGNVKDVTWFKHFTVSL